MAPSVEEAGREGWWGSPTSSIDWCEDNYQVFVFVFTNVRHFGFIVFVWIYSCKLFTAFFTPSLNESIFVQICGLRITSCELSLGTFKTRLHVEYFWLIAFMLLCQASLLLMHLIPLHTCLIKPSPSNLALEKRVFWNLLPPFLNTFINKIWGKYNFVTIFFFQVTDYVAEFWNTVSNLSMIGEKISVFFHGQYSFNICWLDVKLPWNKFLFPPNTSKFQTNLTNSNCPADNFYWLIRKLDYCEPFDLSIFRHHRYPADQIIIMIILISIVINILIIIVINILIIMVFLIMTVCAVPACYGLWSVRKEALETRWGGWEIVMMIMTWMIIMMAMMVFLIENHEKFHYFTGFTSSTAFSSWLE